MCLGKYTICMMCMESYDMCGEGLTFGPPGDRLYVAWMGGNRIAKGHIFY